MLMQKYQKGKAASKYRPITCLPLVWKLLIGVIAEEMYEFLDTNLLLPQEQKGCSRKSRGTNDLLFIDKMIMREVKIRKRHLSMAWIEVKMRKQHLSMAWIDDYKKAYDMVTHLWIIDCLETVEKN